MAKEKTEVKEKSEITHDNNIFNLFSIVSYCAQFGSVYNPGNEDLTIANMTDRWTEVGEMQKSYKNAVVDRKVAINLRQEKMVLLKSMTRRACNSLLTTKEDQNTKEDVKRLMQTITGDNVRRKKDKEGNVEKNTVSNSHLGVDDVLGNFREFIVLLEACTYYNAQESILKVANLKLFYEEIDNARNDVILKAAVASTLMNARDKGLYGRDGLVDVSLACKRYMRSLFGARSVEAKTVSAIKLKRLKRIVELPAGS
jgi:hypothetical protein